MTDVICPAINDWRILSSGKWLTCFVPREMTDVLCPAGNDCRTLFHGKWLTYFVPREMTDVLCSTGNDWRTLSHGKWLSRTLSHGKWLSYFVPREMTVMLCSTGSDCRTLFHGKWLPYFIQREVTYRAYITWNIGFLMLIIVVYSIIFVHMYLTLLPFPLLGLMRTTVSVTGYAFRDVYYIHITWTSVSRTTWNLLVLPPSAR
jgi:hypothetical protein